MGGIYIMKKFIKLTALLLCIAMLTSTFAGCGMFYDDTPEDVFDHPRSEKTKQFLSHDNK